MLTKRVGSVPGGSISGRGSVGGRSNPYADGGQGGNKFNQQLGSVGEEKEEGMFNGTNGERV